MELPEWRGDWQVYVAGNVVVHRSSRVDDVHRTGWVRESLEQSVVSCCRRSFCICDE